MEPTVPGVSEAAGGTESQTDGSYIHSAVTAVCTPGEATVDGLVHVE